VVQGTSTPTGLLKITVIGQSEANPNAFETRVAFKRGLSQNPLFTSARTVTNWDFVNHVVPEARVASLLGLDLSLSNRRGTFPPAPFYVTIGGLSTPLQTALVTQVNSPAQLRLSAPITPIAGDRVQVAAALGAPSGLDYDADGSVQGAATDASGRRVIYSREAVAWSSAETPGASQMQARVNGGLIWMGNALLRNNAQAQASGLMALRDVPGSAQALPRAVSFNGYSARLIDSRDPNFPIFQGQDENGAPVDRGVALSSIRDGMDRLRGVPNTPRDVADVVPPAVASSQSDVSRYRELSKFSSPNLNITDYGSNPAGGSGALYGYGEGIYIDNGGDQEQLTTTASGVTATRAMTSGQLRQMLFGAAASTSAGLGTSFQRAVKPYGIGQKATVGGAGFIPTLEQKHLRGWIGPDEFRARGVLIEPAPDERYFASGTNDDRTIYVTMDALSDQGPAADGTNANAPDSSKSYHLADGSLAPDVTRYRRRLPWPQNGVVFAEGNVRLKGGAFDAGGRVNSSVDPHRSLTIVTMNNAYIEGSLNAGARKIAILARNNVILNPTAVLSRLEAQTTVRARLGSPRGSIVTVDDGTLFQAGDWVEVNNGGPYRVSGTPTLASVPLSPPYTGTATNPVLRAIEDPLFDSGSTAFPYFDNAVRLGKASDIVQRRFMLPRGASSVRLSLRHSAFRREAFAVKADRMANPPLAPSTIDFSSKMISGGDLQTSLIPAADKYLRVDYGGAAPGAGSPDLFSNVAPSSASDLATSNTFRLGVLGATQGIEKQIEDRNAVHAPEMWSYNTASTKPLGGYDFDSAKTPPRSPLWFFLAASSNRHTFGYRAGEPLRRKQSLIAAAPATLALGTSVTAFLNASTAPSTITNDRFNPATNAFDERVNQLGFNPQLDGAEDALTIDDTFYTGYVGTATPPTPAPSTNTEQIALDFDITDYALDSRSFAIASPSASGQNLLALTMNNQNVKLNAASDTGLAVDDFFQKGRAKIPYYRLSRLKLDTPGTPTPVFDAGGQLAKIAPGAMLEAQAFVYAQQGSWMVIPGDFYDRTLQTDPAGSFVARANNARAGIDLNRDGVVTRDELTSVYRLRRYNYKILFRGAIAENQAMPVVAESTATEPGSVSDWMDKWAAFRFTSASGDFDDARRDGIAGSTATARRPQAELPLSDANPSANFGNISYEFDPAIASSAAFSDTGLRPPMPPDLLYQN